MVSRCLSATGIRFSAILFPPESWALLAVGLPNPRFGPRRGYHVPHARAATGEGALWTPGTTVLTPTEATTGRAPAASQRPVPAPRRTSHRQGSRLTRHQRGFKQFARPAFPSSVAARMERAALGLEPRASHPADQEPDSARRGGDRSSSTNLELHAQLTSADLQSSSSLNACDLASHVAKGVVRQLGGLTLAFVAKRASETMTKRRRKRASDRRPLLSRDSARPAALALTSAFVAKGASGRGRASHERSSRALRSRQHDGAAASHQHRQSRGRRPHCSFVLASV